MSNENLKWIAGNSWRGECYRIYSIWDTREQAEFALLRHQEARRKISAKTSLHGDSVWCEPYMTDGDLEF